MGAEENVWAMKKGCDRKAEKTIVISLLLTKYHSGDKINTVFQWYGV